ncbi:MAG: class I SAM-dependent methyltransferase, partial [Planctomycetota bacterium]
MKRYFAIKSWLPGLLAVCLLAGTTEAKKNDAITRAKKILDTANDRYTVHGLEADPAKVDKARSYIKAQGTYGAVSVEQFSGSALPYTDNLINLVVVQDAGKVPMGDVMRVLAPGGAACVQRKGKWEKTVKAWPDNIDQWTHFLHDASNNAVANDSVVGPPRSLQWVAPPLWLRSHETPSGIQSPVSAAGRLFYFFDEGLI